MQGGVLYCLSHQPIKMINEHTHKLPQTLTINQSISDQVKLKSISREKHLNYHLEMMGSQLDLVHSTMVKMDDLPREIHLDHHLEMMMGSQLDRVMV